VNSVKSVHTTVTSITAKQKRDSAYDSPSSVSPHAVRRGSITHSLNSEMPETATSDRANVLQSVLEQHYDRRTKREKMEQRREYLHSE
jgi:hypothetical protein